MPEITPRYYDEDLGHDDVALINYTPDAQKYPVPRTPWDGKPDFTGVYWSSDAAGGGRNNATAVAKAKTDSRLKAVATIRSLTRPEETAARLKFFLEIQHELRCP